MMGVTMEMVRYLDEWEQLKLYLPQGMHTALQMAPALRYSTQFDMRAMELLGGITGSGIRPRTVRRLASTIRRPELDVARDIARLIHDGHVIAVAPSQYQLPPINNARSPGVRLPDPAERLRMESFELLDLLGRMEQEWIRRRLPDQQLSALVEFINWTMNSLADTCRANNTELNPATLENLLTRHNLRNMGTYRFHIYNNIIDVDDFTLLCRGILQGDLVKANDFFEEASIVLQKILLLLFDTINGRVASLHERLENQEVWEAMFTQFNLPRE
ncbi:MAG TPA: hypothetical protein VGS41_13425 [Chthonomonadales bacterium]|nr:hypothetical protein [Chthonomonadales bacterium]